MLHRSVATKDHKERKKGYFFKGFFFVLSGGKESEFSVQLVTP
jgi:hypothetical protein